MESSQENSPAPSISSKGLKNSIAKARVRKNDIYASPVNDGGDAGERSGLRNSVDSLMDRARSTRTGSLDDGLPSSPSNLSKFIPGRVKKKKRKRAEALQAQKEVDDGRGRSAEDQAATSALSQPLTDNRSRSTLGDGEGSLTTYDSDTDSPTLAKPALMNHDSHIGYLTTSSPLIKTTFTQEPQNNEQPLTSPEFLNPEYQKSHTLPTSPSSSTLSSTLAPQHAATFDTRRNSSQASTNGKRSRGISPGARIKDVLTGTSRNKPGSPPKSPNRSSQASDVCSSLLELPKKGSKANSISVMEGSDVSATVPSSNVANPTKSTDTGGRDPPNIMMTPKTPASPGLGTPETMITPPTPVNQRRDLQDSPPANGRPSSASAANPNITVSPSGNMISHRRIRSESASNIPSKLSQAVSPPLTPMAEEGRTPGGNVRPGSPGSVGGGFFSSVFSVAQNMTNTLTNSMSNPTRSRSSTQIDEVRTGVILESEEENATNTADQTSIMDQKKPLAVETLGSGELSLSHLGISTDSLGNGNSSPGSLSNSERNKGGIAIQREEAAARAEDASALRAVSAAYNEKTIGATPVAEDNAPSARPVSTYEASIATGEKTPPNGSIYEGGGSIRRSGSVRSRVGGVVRKHRNSSSTTATTIGAAIGAGAILANPNGTKPTGFAVASKKRNREYHQLFRSVPEDDYLIEDYSCALQREIILAGRIYISEGHICFSSNILGWVTTLVINFDEIVSVEKESTAMVFPNAIAIQTLHARHTFRSLLSRESTYELLIGIWKLSHPNLKSSLNGARLDPGETGDKTEKVDPSGSDEASEEIDEEEEVYDEDQEEDEDAGSVTENGGGSLAGPATADDPKANSRKVSSMGIAAGAAAAPVPTTSGPKAAANAAVASAANQDFPGPATHAPTECPDVATHYDKELKDDIIAAPLGKVFSLVFGPASGGFMAKWLLDDMKCTDLDFEDDKKGLTTENKSRSMSYIKPLYAPIGPKTTKCLVTETLDFMDYEKAVCVTASTQTPDVPSGNIFVTKTHFCFMWAANNATRVVMNYTIEWSGKSWLKTPIEKGATEGQTTYCNDLVKALKAGLSSQTRAGASSKIKGAKGTGKRRKRSTSTTSKPGADEKTRTAQPQKATASWGPLEPIHGLLAPVLDIFAPYIGANTIIAFLLFVIIFNYFRRNPSLPHGNSGIGYGYSYPPPPPLLSSPERAMAYEQLWRREEAHLWDWLDRRVAVNEIFGGEDGGESGESERKKEKERQRVLVQARKKQIEDERMNEREVEDAIRVTEERLEVLKRAVREKKKAGKGRKREEKEGG